jgi:hypothetical protein
MTQGKYVELSLSWRESYGCSHCSTPSPSSCGWQVSFRAESTGVASSSTSAISASFPSLRSNANVRQRFLLRTHWPPPFTQVKSRTKCRHT